MKAIRYTAPEQYRISDVDRPEPMAGEVLVAVQQAGLCGTDVHIHHGHYAAAFPVTLGHEMVGFVAELGDGVTRFAVGDQVSINPNIACGICSYCQAGRPTQCRNPIGLGSLRDGFFADYACVSESLVFSATGLTLDTAVFTEPTACAMHGLETLQVRPGSSALVMGSGPTGLLLAQLLATGGAASVTVASDKAFQLEVAADLGATRTAAMRRGETDTNLAALREHTDDGGYDVVVEATGALEVAQLCVPLVRNGGSVLFYGVTRPEDQISIAPHELFRRELTLRGSYAEMTSFGAAIAALQAGRVATTGLISHRFSLDAYANALATLEHDPRAHKIVLTV
jgi:D-arabinitol dehydrogenase (NADP+)